MLHHQAVTAFNALLKLVPHDPGVLRELVPIHAASGHYSRASSLYIAALQYYRTLVPHVTFDNQDDLCSFGIEDLELLADLLHMERRDNEVVYTIKETWRWLQGREYETGWNKVSKDDDREYDLARKVRDGWDTDPKWKYLEEAGVYELDVKLRLRLGVARMSQGKVDEARHHFAIVQEEHVSVYPELFGAIAESYFENKLFEDALDVFQVLAENEDVSRTTSKVLSTS